MKKNIVIILVYCVFVLLLPSFAGCDLFGSGEGNLVLQLNDSSRGSDLVWEPTIEMDITSYLIEGDGPRGNAFTVVDFSEGTFVRDGLAAGPWVITLTGYNENGDEIATATLDVTVRKSQTTTTTAFMRPLEGNGTLSVDMDWVDSEEVIASPQVWVTIRDRDGDEIIVDSTEITVDGMSAAGDFTLAAGWYEVTVGLYEDVPDTGKELVWDGVFALRIVKEEITTGTISVSEEHIQLGVGSVEVDIQEDMENPLAVSFTGLPDSVEVGEEVTLTAAGKYSGDEQYRWYVNGEKVGEGSPFTYTFTQAGTFTLSLLVFDEGALGGYGKNLTVNETETIEVSVTGVSINELAQEISKGQTLQLTATLTPEDATNQEISWESENDKIVSVNGNGLITGLLPGNTIITVRTKDGYFSDSVSIIVAYEIGDLGPAKGYIFYDDTLGFDLNEDGRISVTEKDLLDGNNDGIIQGHRYLEVAPYGWYDSDDDGEYGEDNDPDFFEWGVFGTYGGVISSNSGIGYGRDNTDAIVSYHENLEDLYPEIGSYEYNAVAYHSLNDGTLAAKACQEANINGYYDWFLPSKFELIALFENLYKNGIGGLQNSYYWSSTDSFLNTAYYVWMYNGNSYKEEKFSSYSVRAVRSF